jgi:hypothetical protein
MPVLPSSSRESTHRAIQRREVPPQRHLTIRAHPVRGDTQPLLHLAQMPPAAGREARGSRIHPHMTAAMRRGQIRKVARRPQPRRMGQTKLLRNCVRPHRLARASPRRARRCLAPSERSRRLRALPFQATSRSGLTAAFVASPEVPDAGRRRDGEDGVMNVGGRFDAFRALAGRRGRVGERVLDALAEERAGTADAPGNPLSEAKRMARPPPPCC